LDPELADTTAVRRGGGSKKRLLLTVMFTDIVGSTELASQLGDKQWRQVLGRHNSILRKNLKRHGGREVDTAGDGFFATFDQPAAAVACARAVSAELAGIDIAIRAGIHMGEVEVEGGDVSGLAVHIGSRVMSGAGPGEILVSSTVRDLMTGSDLSFDDRGVHPLKGVPAEWHLYAVEPIEKPVEDVEAPHAALRPRSPEDEGARRSVLPTVALIAVGVAVAVAVFLFTPGAGKELGDPAVNTVVKIDPSNNEVSGGIPVGTSPSLVAADGERVWVANFRDETLQSIDANTDEASPGRALIGAPTGLAVGDGLVWLTNHFEETLYRLDPSQARSTEPIEVGKGAYGVVFAEEAAWVANRDLDQVMRVETDGEVTTIDLPAGSAPKGIAFGDGFVWVGESLAGKVAKIDPSNNELVSTISLVSGQPEALAFGEGYLWVSDVNGDAVTRIDPATGLTSSIPDVGDAPSAIATGGGAVWVTNSNDDSVVRIDPAKAQVVERVDLNSGGSPVAVAVTSDAVWVAVRER
jgi:class 3 adenylate cyclase/DNA-binding beta-propeller fold protein YncE